MQRIDARRLIPGRGDPIADASVVFDGTISYVGPTADAPDVPSESIVTTETVMPGLWDCHTHLMGNVSGNLDEVIKVPLPVAAARAASDVSRAIDAGFTSVREVGGLGIYVARVVDEGTLVGPHVYAAGSLLSTTGGHADLHAFPVTCVTSIAEWGGYLELCDGVSSCLRGVRMQLRRGAKLIKICASGGVLSEVDHPIHQQFGEAELAAIVEEATRAERIVAAHCHGKPGIVAALEAGCGTIEHGSYLDDETVSMMRDRDAILVSTRYIVQRLVDLGPQLGIPQYALDKARALADRHAKAMRLAIDKGVRMALGTDIATTGERSLTPWGTHAQELVHLVDAGLSPLAAIEAATANGPLTLGPQAPRSGRLETGYDGDVICVDGDPLEDVALLTNRANVTHVFKGGARLKG